MSTSTLESPVVPHGRVKRKLSDTVKNFWLDIVLVIAFVVDMNLQFTGLLIHEWLGIAFGIALVYHLLLHWQWLVSVTQRLFRRLPAGQRLKYFVDWALFVNMVLLVATGLWISQEVLAPLGIPTSDNPLWRQIHHITADLSIWLVALHLALNWKWILSTAKRYLWRPFTA
ncbi:MAG: cytochrome b/b6 domain-containing protein, partial [Anaerolineales bacterium]|nr:cytochrome b/b6 domain-containing protein [Anaerolineales bacterium]